MSGTRALFASIGAGVSLVAAAALSLLAVSAVFAFGGWSDPVINSVQNTTITLAVGAGPSSPQQRAVVLPARKERAAKRKPEPRRRPASRTQNSPPQMVTQPAVTNAPPEVSLPPQTEPEPEPAAPMPAATQQSKSVGDGVRAATDGLSNTVDTAGSALAQVTQPLAPPVSSAVQKITNLLVDLLRRAGEDVGYLLNRVLPAR